MSKVRKVKEGDSFGKLTVIRLLPRNPGKGVDYSKYWLCKCECGNIIRTREWGLWKGVTLSCGCERGPKITHGLSNSQEYKIWEMMVQRTTNPGHSSYDRYGGRGITLCDEWRNSFEAFYAHIGNRPGPEYSVERVDNEKGYCPGNVKWATRVEQQNNKRNNRLITYDGKTKTLSTISKERGFNKHLIRTRILDGWTEEDAVNVPKLTGCDFVRSKEQLNEFKHLTGLHTPEEVKVLMDLTDNQFAHASIKTYGFVIKE